MRHALTLLAVLLAMGCSSSKEPAPAVPGTAKSGDLVISGPFVHEGLAVYLLEDPNATSRGEFITLAEGIASGAVKVTEKKAAQVSELLIENSSDKACFVQAGDLVKGGQQDRTIAADFVIPPRSTPAPIPSFCVEQGRWGGGKVFQGYGGNTAGKDLKLAVQLDKNQGKVWDSVAKTKGDFRANNGLPESKSTSLNEELDHKKMQERREAFRKALGTLIEGRAQAVGLVTAVNGEFSTADVYGDPGLFRKLYDRLIDTAALEAMAVAPKSAPAPAPDAVAAFLRKADEGASKQEQLRDGLEAQVTENEQTARFRCLYNKTELHRQAVKK